MSSLSGAVEVSLLDLPGDHCLVRVDSSRLPVQLTDPLFSEFCVARP